MGFKNYRRLMENIDYRSYFLGFYIEGDEVIVKRII